MNDHPDNGDWKEHRRLILAELKSLNAAVTNLYTIANELKVELAVLKVKSGGWGFLGGLVPVLIALGIFAIKALVGGDG